MLLILLHQLVFQIANCINLRLQFILNDVELVTLAIRHIPHFVLHQLDSLLRVLQLALGLTIFLA